MNRNDFSSSTPESLPSFSVVRKAPVKLPLPRDVCEDLFPASYNENNTSTASLRSSLPPFLPGSLYLANNALRAGLTVAGRSGLSPSTILYMTAIRLVPEKALLSVHSSYNTAPSDLQIEYNDHSLQPTN